MKEHALFACGHSIMCIECYNESYSEASPGSRDFGATESEDDDEKLYEEDGKFAQRSKAEWDEFMRADTNRDLREAKFYENRSFDACHVCRLSLQ